ncbi:hypothetical protein [Salipiger sp. PrR002]|uniref:hypothetical protein n=1 Tax=Salipiger sp. PrR002 TaxID=2706489 RepID=UPI0013BD6BAA|nr:hypothetical protein [Salipiger sp. PrR002]NDW00953.1 hypothetical protein [Salipiger sp. PrR002]NDW56500.1 hypothetical protein [Salipiger sp. PrR004]
MSTQVLSRKEKRAIAARGAKLYGVGGDAALAIHQAYQLIKAGQLPEACQLVVPLTRAIPDNPHPWVILGMAALKRREAQTSKAFFAKAEETAPKLMEVLTGLAKSHFLCGEPEPTLKYMAAAFQAGNREVPMMKLYLSLMSKAARVPRAVEVLGPIAEKIDDPELTLEIGTQLAETEDGKAASVKWLERGYQLSPDTDQGKMARLSALFHAGRMVEAEEWARELLAGAFSARDLAMVILLGALRFQSRHQDLIEAAEGYEFTDPASYARSRAFVANAYLDAGDYTEARHAYLESMHMVAELEEPARAYGTFCFSLGDYEEGVPNYFRRHTPNYRATVPSENSEKENLMAQDRILLIGEQGIGDQLALLALTRVLPVKEGCEVIFAADPRQVDLLDGNALGLKVIAKDDIGVTIETPAKGQAVALGDLVRFIPDHPAAARRGSYLRPDPRKVREIRQRYAALAGDRPIFGMAWAARSLIGYLRSVPLEEMVQLLPEGAFVVNLQYGRTDEEIAAARAVRPDLEFYTDPEVDQMSDLASFAAQCAAVERVVTIDNTTAHICGALGHPETHVLVPTGAECMWYWGREAETDPWYGVLTLHRQQRAGDWTEPFAALREVCAA